MFGKTLSNVDDYYQDELFKFIPESMFEILDKAYYMKNHYCWIPDVLIDQYHSNKNNIETYTLK